MKYNNIGNTGISVSEVGFGAWGIGGPTPGATSYGHTDDTVSRNALKAARDLGINFFDTAPVYGLGHSEELIGSVFGSAQRDQIVISTKVGCEDYQGDLDFSASTVTLSVEDSLRRLQSDYIDILMLHDPVPTQPGLDETFTTLDRLRRDGKIRATGISVREPEHVLSFLDCFETDAIQANLNLMDQRAITSGALDLANERGVGFIARTPLCFGFLSDRLQNSSTFDPSDHRSRWPLEQIRCWQEGGKIFAELFAEDGGAPLATNALRFCISVPGVSSVLPGIMTMHEAHVNAEASELGEISSFKLEEIQKVYGSRTFFLTRPAEKLATE